MPLRPYLFRKVTIIGVGLIGGSLGLALKKHKLAKEIVGMSQKPATLSAALKHGAIDQGYHDVPKAVAGADLVVLATPVGIISGMLATLGPHLKRGCVVTDVGSSKEGIVRDAEQSLPGHVFFVGSHPLAGSEKKGVQNAREDLFNESLCIMTPTGKTHRSAIHRVKKLWGTLGCKVKLISAEEHDRVMAYTSHLPHVLAFTLMETIPEPCLEYAAQGLKDTTRIAGSSPQMWNDICLENAQNIIRGLDETVKHLSALRKAMASGDSKVLTDHFTKANAKREKLDK